MGGPWKLISGLMRLDNIEEAAALGLSSRLFQDSGTGDDDGIEGEDRCCRS